VRRNRDGFFLRAESFYNVATAIDRLDGEPSPGRPVIDSYGGVSLHEQSHGEAFLALFMNRFGGKGLYLLDEPEAALSPTRQMALISRLHDLVEDESQFVIATHSPIIMAYPKSRIFLLTEDGIEEIAYEDTEHYCVTRDFLSNREKMLRILMEE
jgi:predicted ATPase